MQIGERIKQARVHRGLTQKELGKMVGFDEKTADVCIAQYESSMRTPKADMRNKLAEALDINSRYFLIPTSTPPRILCFCCLSLTIA
jgi:transcriptional regulator with XRE-family HTH domain